MLFMTQKLAGYAVSGLMPRGVDVARKVFGSARRSTSTATREPLLLFETAMTMNSLAPLRLARQTWRLGCRYSSNKAYDPLRILFCGSDDFSIASLRAVHREHVRSPDTIASIDVVCRPGKRTGRGLKNIREGASHQGYV